MSLKNEKGSILLMVTVFAMIFLTLAILTMKTLFTMEQQSNTEDEIARIYLFYAADGVSELAMYSAAKNLMYDPRGHNTNNANSRRRLLTSFQMDGDIWPNKWSIASGVHPDYNPIDPGSPLGVHPVIANSSNTNDTNARVQHMVIYSTNIAAIASSAQILGVPVPIQLPTISSISVIPAVSTDAVDTLNIQYDAYDVDFNFKYKSNSTDTFMTAIPATDPRRVHVSTRTLHDGTTAYAYRQIWYPHLSLQNDAFDPKFDYSAASTDFWIPYHNEEMNLGVSTNGYVEVKATMYQEFVIPPGVVVDTNTVPPFIKRDKWDTDLIRLGDGWPNIQVSSGSSGDYPRQVRFFEDENNNGQITSGDVNMGTSNLSHDGTSRMWFYNDIPRKDNYYSGGNAARRFFVILAEARFDENTRNTRGGVFRETYKIETRFFIEDERTSMRLVGATKNSGTQYENYHGLTAAGFDLALSSPTNNTNKPRVKFYFRSRIPRPI